MKVFKSQMDNIKVGSTKILHKKCNSSYAGLYKIWIYHTRRFNEFYWHTIRCTILYSLFFFCWLVEYSNRFLLEKVQPIRIIKLLVPTQWQI